jgi:hypothetical protein
MRPDPITAIRLLGLLSLLIVRLHRQSCFFIAQRNHGSQYNEAVDDVAHGRRHGGAGE